MTDSPDKPEDNKPNNSTSQSKGSTSGSESRPINQQGAGTSSRPANQSGSGTSGRSTSQPVAGTPRRVSSQTEAGTPSRPTSQSSAGTPSRPTSRLASNPPGSPMDIGASQPRTGSASQSASEFERLVPNSTGSFASSAAASREPGSHGGLGSPGSERPGQDRDRPNQKRSGGKLPPWLRMSLIILLKTIRILLVPALCVGALLVGLTIGYSIIGDGDATDVLKLSTWKHLYDLVFQGT